MPRLTVRAGFELGTGVEINVYPPERAAADLREARWAAEPRQAELPMMPPVPRPFPGFIADSPQEGRPYGRWAERLAEEFAKACEPHARRGGRAARPRASAGFPSAAGAAGSTFR